MTACVLFIPPTAAILKDHGAWPLNAPRILLGNNHMFLSNKRLLAGSSLLLSSNSFFLLGSNHMFLSRKELLAGNSLLLSNSSSFLLGKRKL